MEKIDFDQLCKQAYQADANLQDKDALWLEVFKLDEWFFIAQSDAEEIQPYIGTSERLDPESIWLFAFTDANRATYFAKQQNIFSNDLVLPIQAIRNGDESLSWIESFKTSKVKGVFFNAEGHGFFTSLSQLRLIKAHLLESYPQEFK